METKKQTDSTGTNMARRMFLRYASAAAASAGLVAVSACHKDHKVVPDNGIDIGVGDMGLFNYFYIFKQIQAALYKQILTTPYTGMTTADLSLLTARRDHEILQGEFLKTTIGSKALVSLPFDLSKIDFTNRITVLLTAKIFEDKSVMAFAGTTYLIQSATNLTIAAKIAAVEGRHAAVIGNMLQNGYFASTDVIGSNGLNESFELAVGLQFINQYLSANVSAVAFNYIIA